MSKFALAAIALSALLGITAKAQTNIVAQTINGTPQADQFAGVDMCDKLRAANIYAIAHNLHFIDATHFTGTQSCSVDPFANLNGTTNASLQLTDQLGAVTVNASVPVVITSSGFHLEGMGYSLTIWRYNGTSLASAAITTQSPGFVDGVDSPTSNLYDITIRDISIIGGSGNATDALRLNATHHSEIANVSAWGAINCGIHTYFAVTDTYYRPKVSNGEAGILNYGGTTPQHGLCFDGHPGWQTTDGTVIDAAAEGLTGVGWWLANASSMTFTSGTSESNNAGGSADTYGGMQVDSESRHNTFISCDFEANGGNADVFENGYDNSYIHVIAVSGNGIVGGPSSAYITADNANGYFTPYPGSRSANRVGSEMRSAHDVGGDFNGSGYGWNALGNGEADWDTDVSFGPYAHVFRAHSLDHYNVLGGFTTNGSFIVGGALRISAPTTSIAVPAGTVAIGTETRAEAASGSAQALPGNPAGYLLINIGGTPYSIPYFNF